MDGAKDGSDPGMYTLSLDSLFRLTQRRSADDAHATIKISLLEIYNEKLTDLLVDSTKRVSKAPAPERDLAIRKHPKTGEVVVEGLTEVVVKSTQEVHATIAEGKKLRSVRATDYNLHSSRSHLVLLVRVTMRGGCDDDCPYPDRSRRQRKSFHEENIKADQDGNLQHKSLALRPWRRHACASKERFLCTIP